MRIPVLVLGATLLAALPTAAQVRLGGRLGATWSSTLVEDEIGTPIEVEAGIAPTLTLNATIPTGKKYRIGLETSFSTSGLDVTDDLGTTDLGSLRTASIQVVAGGPAMVQGFFWQAGIGFLKYLPSEKEGLFRQGGPARILGTFTVEYRRVLRPGWEWMVAAKYGLHQFITKELESRGFSRAQMVHRVGLEAGVARYFQ